MTSDLRNNDDLLMEIFKALNNDHEDQMRNLLERILNISMKLEREEAIGASSYERNTQRQGYANGYKPKRLNSRLGPLELDIPQTRGIAFYPKSIEKGSRSERALKVAVAEMYLKGVSTRRVEAVTQALCGLNFSSTQVSRAAQELDEEFKQFRERPIGKYAYIYLDATYLKVRHCGTVIDQATLIAYGVNPLGKREILGISMSLSEAEVHWREFLESLSQRGLNGLELIISDKHPGLRESIRTVFPAVKWQRCQFHMTQNALKYAPKKTLQEPIVEAMREIFNSSTLEKAQERAKQIEISFATSAPEFAKWLEENIGEGLTCFHFPKEHRRRIRTVNGLERVNREIKRRTRVAVLFPNSESALRLVTGVLIEIHEEWATGMQYLNMKLSKKRTNEG